jgi:hypothetical protein
VRLLTNRDRAPGKTCRLAYGQPLHLGQRAGELTVIEGQVWLTCSNDLCDHFLNTGQRVQLAAGSRGVVETAVRSQDAKLHWRPRSWSLVAILLTPPLRATALAASVAALALTALARNANIGVRRLQGSRDW